MLKNLSVLAAVIGFSASPLYAQTQEVFLQTIEVPGAAFDLALSTPKPELSAVPALAGSPEAAIVRLDTGERALVLQDTHEKLVLNGPVCAFHLEGSRHEAAQPVSVYTVGKGRGIAISAQMRAGVEASGVTTPFDRKQEALLHRIEVPGRDFGFVLAAPKPGAGALPDIGNMPDALVMHLHGGNLVVMFQDADEMLNAVEVLRFPVCAYAVDGRPAALYVVPKVERLTSSEQAAGFETVQIERVQTNLIEAAEVERMPATADLTR